MSKLFCIVPFLDKDRSYSLKGIVMILIICHHIYQRVDFTQWPLGNFLSSFGYIGTGIFFFLSGFGLFMSLKRKTSLTIEWLLKKMEKLIFPFVFIMFIVGPLCLLIKEDYTFDVFIKDFFTLTTPYTFAWFYKVIVGIYVVVFLIFRLNIDNYKKVGILSTIVFIYYVLAKLYLPGYWSSSVLNFPLGMIVGLFWNKINASNIVGGVNICQLLFLRI